MIARVHGGLTGSRSESGVALLQVLLISAVISILAVRFTLTAQNQLEMASQFDQRVFAELKAKSVLNEVIFLQLSEKIRPYDVADSSYSLLPRPTMNRYGDEINWSKGVKVWIQDMNGLIPQMFVGHFLWKPVLLGLSFNEKEVERYLGTWGDMQDDDLVSWEGNGDEPVSLPNGAQFINGYAQNNKLLSWIFSESQAELRVLNEVSDISAPYETNLLNAPDELLTILLEPSAAEEFIKARRSRNWSPNELISLLPEEYQSHTVASYRSNDVEIRVQVTGADNLWIESRVISLTSGSKPPFEVRLKE